MPSLRQFEIFRELARRRHFGRAAQALGVTQPALTRSLQSLERRLGVSLFDRQEMAPTVFGEAALRFADPAVGGFSELLRELALLQGVEAGGLKVSMGPYPADISGGLAAAALSSEHPRLAIALRVCDWSGATRDAMDNAADLALADVSEAEERAELETEILRRSRGRFFCRAAHPLARRKRLALSDLFGYPLVCSSYPARARPTLPEGDRPFGVFDPERDRFTPRILVETFSMSRDIVLNSDAIGAFVPGQRGDELEQGRCVALPVESPALRLNYGFIVKRGRMLSPAARAFMEAVRRIEQTIPE